MPTISIFIRKDDLPIWQALDNKSEWLSQRLNSEWATRDYRQGEEITVSGAIMSPLKMISGTPPSLARKAEPFIGDNPVLVPPVAKTISRGSNGLCKIHGLPLDARGRCLQKGCRYS